MLSKLHIFNDLPAVTFSLHKGATIFLKINVLKTNVIKVSVCVDGHVTHTKSCIILNKQSIIYVIQNPVQNR